MGVFWTQGEKEAITAEGVRLLRAGKATSIKGAFAEAQAALPKHRRRVISTTAKVPWFAEALKAAQSEPEAHGNSIQQSIAPPIAPAPENEPQGEPASRPKIFWNSREKKQLCAVAAQLLTDLQANGPRDALEKAQLIALTPDRRRRKIHTMTSVADWYPSGLQAARAARLNREAEAEAESKQAADAAAVAAASETEEVDDAPEARPLAAVALPVAPAAAPTTIASMFGGWASIRQHLVQEIASIVAEGIHRGLASVQLTTPASQDDNPPAVVRHVPFVVDPQARHRSPSILIVGLKDANASQIKAEFSSKLDLRFIATDKSKDQLRQMAEQADTTVAMVDFLGHSHTDICRARSKQYVESTGGMTGLRQQLTRLAGLHLNGSAAVAA